MLELNPLDLAQTTWSGVEESVSEEYEVRYSHFIMEFHTLSKGYQIDVDENGRPYSKNEFNYKIQGKLISFTRAMVGTWTIMEYTGTSMTLQAYLPTKHVITLTKMY